MRVSIAAAGLAALLFRTGSSRALAVENAVAARAEGDVSLHLGGAAREDAAALHAAQEWNRAGKTPLRVGFARTLAEPLALRVRGAAAGAPTLVSGFLSIARDARTVTARARVRVDEAWATRLHVAAGEPPPGTLLRVRDGAGTVVGEIDLAALPATTGGWLPPTRGAETWIEVVLPADEGAAELSLEVDRVTELFDAAAALRFGRASVLVPSGPGEPPCLVDAMCVTDPALVSMRSSVALYYVDVGPDTFLCSGGLIRSSSTPDGAFFATANHCLGEPGTDFTSIIVFWDFHAESCGAPPPEDPFGPCAFCPGGVYPKSFGATLLATSKDVDFTLLAVGGPASSLVGRDGVRRAAFSPAPALPAVGGTLHRFSHPLGLALRYSEQTVLSTPSCLRFAQNLNFSNSQATTGHIEPGSSGSPAFGDDLKMTGTLYAFCGDTSGEDPYCQAPTAYTITDGLPFVKAAATYSPWLSDCAYPLSAGTVEFEDAGGTKTLDLGATAGCAWTSSSEVSWAAVAPASGAGATTLTFTAPANATGRARVGTIRAGFHLVRVAQYAPDCLAAVTPAAPAPFPPEGGVATLRIEAPAACAWQVGPLPAWLTASPASGSGDGVVTVAVAPNRGSGNRSHALDLVHARTGTATAPVHTLVPVGQFRSTRTPLEGR